MNKSALLITVCAMFWVSSSAIAQEPLQSSILEIEQDRFTGTTTLKGKPASALNTMQVQPMAFIHAEAGKPLEIALFITTAHEDWQYLSCHYVDWLVDGQPMSLPDAIHKGDVLKNGYVLEVLIVTRIPMTDLNRLAASQKIEFKVCNDEFVVAPDRMDEIRELARLVPIAVKAAP